MRDGVGDILGMLQRIKAEGDYGAAKELFERYGEPINAGWRDQVVARYSALNMPPREGELSENAG